MDLFTHIIVAYLVTFGITLGRSPVYIAAGALAGALPDSDILLIPLARRFPVLRHHGITHSFLGVTIFAIGGAILGPFVDSGAQAIPLLLFMELGGLLHIFLDGFTHFSVPPLVPFSDVELRLDADRAVNLGTMAMSLVSFVVLMQERNAVPLATWLLTGWVLLAVYLGYLTLRATSRYLAGRAKVAALYTAVIPTGNPLDWFLVDEKEGVSDWQMRVAVYKVGRGIVAEHDRIALRKTSPSKGPITTNFEALQRSYTPAMERSRFLASSFRYADVSRQGENYFVEWFSLEYLLLGKAPGIAAEVDAKTGNVKLRRSWFSISRLAKPLPPV
jgi:membrane-bound metal-dependent hydrolase YbcI (DUF457 family)